MHPVQERLVELLDEGPFDLEAAVHLLDVPGTGSGETAPTGRTAQQYGVTDPLRAHQGISRPCQRRLEQRRYGERDRDVVEDADDDGIVTVVLGDGDRLVCQGLPALEWAPDRELRTQDGKKEGTVGMVS